MSDFPRSLIAFQRRFADEDACVAYLLAQRWPDGFRCPACGHDRAWTLKSKPRTFECTRCHRQTSVTAGTVMHGTKLALPIWFWAAYLMATHSNGISALQLKAQLGLGSYKSAWLLCAKLRGAMVAPGRKLLTGLVEVDETTIPYRTHDDPVAAAPGRSHAAKMALIGAVETREGGPGRIRLAPIADYSATTLHGFLAAQVAPEATIKTDGWPAYQGAPQAGHEPHTIGTMAAHIVLPWAHRVFANLKRWALGVYHGLRKKHLQAYLDEFVFRFNRRRTRPAAFRSLLQIAARTKPVTYKMLIQPEPGG